MEPNRPVCGHTYSRPLGKKIFICLEAPHPSQPGRHHFRAAPAEMLTKRHLISIMKQRS